ncbi:GHMP family kinase ATP-binding protein [Vibrio salinus]|uniref:GHMP family kinase ATP-binding protein n=1 Tax=Vibrio salinus TaxID=2899784 RepID=UPI001E528D09|nr:hypothetical protein [Vibrio salinus]MCE0495652.1 hypothetical protein [Vibrio salinus]
MYEAQCPGTCGELLQGWMMGSEKLISCPINRFSRIRIEDGRQDSCLPPLIEQTIQLTLQHLGVDLAYRHTLNIHHSSDLPVAKGYASSTADMSATVVALSRYFKHTIAPGKIAELTTRIEPSDGVMFKGLALFEHTSGHLYQQYTLKSFPSILVLEPERTVLTRDFHNISRKKQLITSQPSLNEALSLFEQGIKSSDINKIGHATTVSAQAHQKISANPLFSQIEKCCENNDLPGLCIAHSGSIIGLIYEEKKHNIDSVLSQLKKAGCLKYYNVHHKVKMISGGIS